MQPQLRSPRASAAPLTAFMLGLLWLSSCAKKEPAPTLTAEVTAAPDRLSEEESLPTVQHVLGLEVPNGLRVAANFGDRALLEGPLPINEAIAELAKQVLAGPSEATTERVLIRDAIAKHGSKTRRLNIEVSRRQNTTRVEIADVTPPPTTHGLNEAERWRQAGRNPDGTLLNPRNTY